MPHATFWFASPFREWIGQREVTLTWEGTLTLRGAFERLGAAHPRLHAKLLAPGLTDEAFQGAAAVILDGQFLALDSPLPDGAAVDVLTPLAGGSPVPPGGPLISNYHRQPNAPGCPRRSRGGGPHTASTRRAHPLGDIAPAGGPGGAPAAGCAAPALVGDLGGASSLDLPRGWMLR